MLLQVLEGQLAKKYVGKSLKKLKNKKSLVKVYQSLTGMI